MEDQFLSTNQDISGNDSNGNTANNELPGKKGRKIDPEILSKYLQIQKVMSERPGTFTRMELCKKHGINYHNFSQWLSKQKPKEKEPRFIPSYKPPIVGQSVIMTTVDDLLNAISPIIRDSIKTALLEGIKQNKIKTLG